MPECTLQDVEVTPDGTLVEVIRIADPKDPFWPRLRVREWIDEVHYRDVEVSEVEELARAAGT